MSTVPIPVPTIIPPINILVGDVSEQSPAVNALTASKDITHYLLGTQSWKLSTTGGSGRSYAVFDPIKMSPDPLVIGACSVLGLAIYLPVGSATKITDLELTLYMDAGLSKYCYRSINTSSDGLADGWNYFYFDVSYGMSITDHSSWENIYRILFDIYKTDDIDISFQLWGYTYSKAKILLINDAGYKSFVDNMYPSLKSRNLPVEIALDPSDVGINPGTSNERISWNSLATVMADGNGNGLTFHGYSTTTDDNSTDTLCRTNTLKSLELMASHGYYNPMWRGAFLTNTALGHAGIDDMFPAYATWESSSYLSYSWPPNDFKNINRIGLHWLDSSHIDDLFTRLQYTHGLIVFYMHGCTLNGSTNDVSYAQRDYFLSKVDTGLAAGWLEFVTFPKLAWELGWSLNWDIMGRYIFVPLLDGTIRKYYQPTFRYPTALTRSAIGHARTART